MRALAIFGMALAVLGAPGQAVAQFSLQGNPFGKIEPGVGEPGGMGRPVPAAPGLENARIYQLGALGTPGRWEVRGDGSGPIIVGGDVYVPGGPGQRGRFVETGTSLDARVIGTSGAPAPAEKVRTSREILDEVERKRRAKDALSREGAPEQAPPEPPLALRDLSALPPPKLAELADARDASTRGSALAALEARARVEAEPRASLAARKAAVRAMLAALDDEDLRVVRVAAAALGRLRALAVVDRERINLPEWDKIPTMKEATGFDMSYHMLRGIFLPPGVSKEVQEWYINLFKKVTETPEWKKYVSDSALKPAFLTGPAYVKWLEEKEELTKDLMKKGGLIK